MSLAALQHSIFVTEPVKSKTLSLRLKPLGVENLMSGNESEPVITGAIRAAMRISATYNGGAVVLQPVLLFREHDALFLMAMTVSRDGKPPREAKLGTFRLTGMRDVRRLRDKIDDALVAPADWNADKPGRELVASIGFERAS